MSDLWQYLQQTDKPIILYGTGNGADKIIARLESDGSMDKVRGIFASSGFVRNRSFHGIRVESYEEIRSRYKDMIVLLCFGSSLPEVMNNVDRISSETELYAPQVPVYGNTVFDERFYNENINKIRKAKEYMSDSLSSLTFDNTVKYYLSGKISFLKECETSVEEEFGLTRLPVSSTFIDLGAYTGDTALEYSEVFPEITDIIAVEPDSKNYVKLAANTEGLSIRCLNVLISDITGTAHINLGKGRGVHEQDAGKDIVCDTVDNILEGKRTDLIKYDVEGNELKALKGSAATIEKYKPVLHVACYHRSEDIFELPLYIKSLRDDYKIFMRHRPHLLNWDTQFICI